MRSLILGIALVASGCAARQPMVIQNARPQVRTLPPASFWICPTANRCDTSLDPADIPPGYVCIKQANGIDVCSPGGNVSLPGPAPAPPRKPSEGVTMLEHLAIGAGSYAALGAIAGPSRRWQVGISATALMAGFKEGTDAHDGTDSRGRAALHALMILVGAGAAAAFYH